MIASLFGECRHKLITGCGPSRSLALSEVVGSHSMSEGENQN